VRVETPDILALISSVSFSETGGKHKPLEFQTSMICTQYQWSV